jgi:hypothetical protein
MKCLFCLAHSLRPSRFRWFDWPLLALLLRPYRCLCCCHRSYGFVWNSWGKQHTDPTWFEASHTLIQAQLIPAQSNPTPTSPADSAISPQTDISPEPVVATDAAPSDSTRAVEKWAISSIIEVSVPPLESA